MMHELIGGRVSPPGETRFFVKKVLQFRVTSWQEKGGLHANESIIFSFAEVEE